MLRKSETKEKYYTYKLNMWILNFLAIVLFIVLLGVVFLIEKNDDYVLDSYNLVYLIIAMVGWLIIHEVLHGVGFALFKEVEKENIVFGAALEKGVLYCMCKQKISKRVILTSLLMPVVIIGIITLVVGMILNNYWLVYLSIFNIVGSIGDIVMVIYFLKVPNDIIYLDLDDCTSFTVISRDNLDKIHVWGIDLCESGSYNELEMMPKVKQKLTISKASSVVFVILLVLGVWALFW